jgi:glycosyltransferase involved in cell wall biosynthesis
MNPILSVITPLYNGEKFIAETLESARAQHRRGIEYLVVDDGSTDRSLEIVSGFSKTLPIRIISPGRIGNWVKASNIGLREGTGKWACFLQQDDPWLPGRISKLWEAMEHGEETLILHNAVFIGREGRRLGSWKCPLSHGKVPSELFTERLLIQNFIAVNSPVFRRRAALDLGAMDETLWVCADWDLWLRLGAVGPILFIAEELGAFRVHAASQAAARKLLANEWELQLTTVLHRGLNNWSRSGKYRRSVERVAHASIAVNSSLSAASRRQSVEIVSVLRELLALGPAGWRRYLRDSRIAERVSSRLKAQWLE